MADHRSLDPAARLRLAREAKGLSIRQVAEATKLSVRAIEMLERGRLSELPQGIYRRSIVRAVASEVGVNPEQLLNEFAALQPDELPARTAVVIAEPTVATSFGRALTLMSAALPMIAAIIYFGLPIVRARISEPKKQPLAEPVLKVLPARAEVLPIGGFAPAPALSVRPVPVVVTLTISSRCQLRVIVDGNEIIGRTMEQGETLPIDLGDELLLLGDNASAVQFSINGQAGRQLGAPGDVLSVRIGRDDYQQFLVRY